MPEIKGKASVWSLGADGVEKLGLLQGTDAQRYMHAFHDVVEKMQLKGDLVGAQYANTDWKEIGDVKINFANVYNNPEFVEALKAKIGANYGTLGGAIEGKGGLNSFFDTLQKAYTPR